MKEKYEKPCMILIGFDDADIIRTSGGGNESGGGSDDNWTKDY